MTSTNKKEPFSLLFKENGDGTCTVSGYEGTLPEALVLPDASPKGERVTAVGKEAFAGCKALHTVTLPTALSHIGASAFEGCEGLSLVTFRDEKSALSEIGDSAFMDCFALTAFTFPATLLSIGNFAFYNMGLSGELILPPRLEVIGNYTFGTCDITHARIPASVTLIEPLAFEDCDSLSTVTFEKPHGWQVGISEKKATAPISAAALSDPGTAAYLLVGTYCGDYWKRS